MWNQDKFLKSVFHLVKKACENKQKTFNLKIGDRDAITRWKKGDRPSLEIILRIVDNFDCGFDWLLTGKEQNNFMCGWSEEEIDYCEKLKKVLGNKEDSDIIKKMIDAYADKYNIKKTRKKGTLKQMGT